MVDIRAQRRRQGVIQKMFTPTCPNKPNSSDGTARDGGCQWSLCRVCFIVMPHSAVRPKRNGTEGRKARSLKTQGDNYPGFR